MRAGGTEPDAAAKRRDTGDMEQQFCEQCGAKLEEGGAFCTECGAKTNAGGQVQPPPGASPVTAQPAAPQMQSVPPANGQFTMPPAQPKKTPVGKIVGGVVGGIVVLILLVSVIGGGSGSKSRSSSSSPKQTQAIDMKADEIINEYCMSIDAAEAKFKGKKVTTTGQLITKNQFNNTQDYGLVIAYKPYGGKNYAVVAAVATDRVQEANNVKEGDFVRVTGTCVGIVPQDNPNAVSLQIHADKINR